MSRAQVVPALSEHIAVIAANVREADLIEFAALHRNAGTVMTHGMAVSPLCWTGLIDGEPVCMFGVAPMGFLLPNYGRPWMVGSKGLDRHALKFLRRCKPQVQAMLDAYPVLGNYVAMSNDKAIAWLKWMHFQFGEEIDICGVPFIRFELRRSYEY
jgi:hypothetical protein